MSVESGLCTVNRLLTGVQERADQSVALAYYIYHDRNALVSSRSGYDRAKWVKFVRKHRPDFKDPTDFQVHCALLSALQGRLLPVQIIGDWYNQAEWKCKDPRFYKEDSCAHVGYCCSCSSRRSSQWSNEKTSKPNICDIKTCMFDQLRSTCIRWYKVILFGN